MSNNIKSTAYWAEKFNEWWETKGSKMKRVVYPKDIKKGYYEAYKREVSEGKTPTDIIKDGRVASIEIRDSKAADPLKFVFKDTRTVKAGTRRAKEKGGKYSLDEFIEITTNLFPEAPAQDIIQLATNHYNVNNEELRKNASIKGDDIIREHRNPLSNEEGAGEYYRNIPPDDAEFNSFKSNKIPSDEYLARAGIGRTRQEMVERGLSSAYPQRTLQVDRADIRQDLGYTKPQPELVPNNPKGVSHLDTLQGVRNNVLEGLTRLMKAI